MSAPALASSVDELEARANACDWERVGKELDQVGNAVLPAAPLRRRVRCPRGALL